MGGQPSGLLCFENKLGMALVAGWGRGRCRVQVGQAGATATATEAKRETLIGNSLAAKLVVCLKYLQLFSNYLGKF